MAASDLPRWVHHFYAETAGYFWLPCPECGEMFGGHESGRFSKHMEDGTMQILCQRHTHDIVPGVEVPEGCLASRLKDGTLAFFERVSLR